MTGIGIDLSHAASEIVDFSHPLKYAPIYWITRAPREVFPYGNLLRIFDTLSWFMILFSLLCVSLFLMVAAKLGTHYGVGTDDLVNAGLVPYR